MLGLGFIVSFRVLLLVLGLGLGSLTSALSFSSKVVVRGHHFCDPPSPPPHY